MAYRYQTHDLTYLFIYLHLLYLSKFLYICSGQILTFVKITTRVQTTGGSTSLPVSSAHLLVWYGPKRKASGLTPSLHLIRHHLPRAARLSGTPMTNRRIISFWHKNLSRSHSRLQHKEPSGACYFRATYSWIARSLWFTYLTIPPDHPHVINIVTLLYQYGKLWILKDISA